VVGVRSRSGGTLLPPGALCEKAGVAARPTPKITAAVKADFFFPIDYLLETERFTTLRPPVKNATVMPVPMNRIFENTVINNFPVFAMLSDILRILRALRAYRAVLNLRHS
jgi:hypothetical protein